MSQFIVIPNIKVNNANAQPVWWIISAPPITAYVGFAHALALHLNIKSHLGIAIVHHDIQFLGEAERDFLPHQFRASGLIDKKDYASGSAMSLASQPSARCRLNVSLVISVPKETNASSVVVAEFLRSARLAGGNIIKHGQVKCGVSTHAEAMNIIRKNGYSIVERQDLMIKEVNDRDWIDVLLRQTRRYKKAEAQHEGNDDEAEKTKDKKMKEKSTEPWIVPTCLGYTGISSLELRAQSRHELPHLYVEPLVGLVEYRNTRNANLHFWSYTCPQPNVFITSTHQGDES